MLIGVNHRQLEGQRKCWDQTGKTDRKTLAELKKVQTTQDMYPTKKDVIEDCQVPIDNTAYADWLMEQGIPDGIYKPVDNSKPNEVCKIDLQTAFAEAHDKS